MPARLVVIGALVLLGLLGGTAGAVEPEEPALPAATAPVPDLPAEPSSEPTPLPAARVAPWMRAPIVPKMDRVTTAVLRARVAAGRKLGMRAGVFAKIGDSNTEFAPNFYGLACRPVQVGKLLAATRDRYNRVPLENERALPGCEPWTSFSRRSAAAQAGVYSTWSLSRVADLPDSGYLRKPPDCGLEETPLTCEIRITRPRFALVTLGTNDFALDRYFGITPGSRAFPRIAAVAGQLTRLGVVPVLSSIPPVTNAEDQAGLDRAVARTNAGIFRLARVLRLPFVNLWRAMNESTTINLGLSDDGLHLSVFGADGETVFEEPGPTTFSDSVVFTREALRYGANRRNLIWLKTLMRLDAAVG